LANPSECLSRSEEPIVADGSPFQVSPQQKSQH
jgi:hypothetical protein